MSKFQTILLTLAISFTVFVLVLVSRPQTVSFGSVSRGSEYLSTVTRSIPGTSLTDPSTLCSTNGVLGSVVITGANTGVINFYDATTTGPHSDHATTTIASIPASTAAGTYTFDITTVRGLVYDLDGGNTPTSTVTYKCN